MERSIPTENAFNFLRYALALSLIVAHYTILCDFHTVSYFLPMLVVQGFFIFSGFLTLLSYNNKVFELRPFIRKRLLRLLPPYITVIILCTSMGIFLTDWSVKDYLLSSKVYRYLASNLFFLNFLQPSLPGVFSDNPHTDAVNGSLWTMKVEVLFYAAVPLLFYLFNRFRKGYVLIALFGGSLLWNECFTLLYQKSGNELYNVLRHQIGGQFVYFTIGMALFFYFDHIFKQARIIIPSACLLFVAGFFTDTLFYAQSITYGILLVALAYGCPMLRWTNRLPNLTYGLYLYHFPVIQSLLSLNILQPNPMAGFLLVLVITFTLSYISYYTIEKRIRHFFHFS
ncbi:acyltransferase [Bacteroides acidifaciens]|uniref:acyltransferase family protein n=1 Tax=Bacteroides acidifaciens TaxID=85831 RepID=UPI00258BA6B7|nr:acyltransferase [Bacteroides acidifaciens]